MKSKKPTCANSLPQRKAIASAVILAFASPLALAQYRPNIEVYAKPGTERNYLGVDALVPLVQNGTSMLFGDAKAHLADHDINELNLGLGYRAMTADQQWAWGVYGAYDLKHTRNGNDFSQATVGAEMRSREWDFRTNYYQALTDKKMLGLGDTNHFAGNGVWRNGIYEEALSGADLEVGRLLDFIDRYEVRAYLAAYSFEGKDVAPRADGGRVRLEFRPRKDITLGLSYQHDNVFGSASFLELRYSLGQSAESGVRTLGERMTDPWKRDQDIVTSGAIESSSAGNSVQTADRVVHINDTAAAGGDGSYERPYNAVLVCEGAKCADGSYNMIRLWQGNSASLAGTAYTPMTLQDGQTLWGQGIDLYTGRIQAGQHPVIDSAGGTGVTLASGGSRGNTVAGVSIVGSGAGIVGSNTWGQVTISGNIINATGGGVRLTNSVYDGSTRSQTVAITNNSITNSAYGGGILLENDVRNPSSTLTQTVTMANNAIAGEGIVLRNQAKYGGQATQTATISGNTVTASGRGAVALYNFAFDSGARATQSVTISGNTIDSAYGGGILLSNEALFDGSQAIQSATISGNTIRASYTGIEATNSAYANTTNTATQTLTVSGNTINSAYGGGILLSNEAYGDGNQATQTVTISGNTITASDTGIEATNSAYADTTNTATQTLTISGNTINASTGIALDNSAYANNAYAETATQSATISGNTLTATGGSTGINISNYDNGNHDAVQTVTVSGSNSVAGFSQGVSAYSNGDHAASAQTVTVSGLAVSGAAPGSAIVRCQYGSAAQTVTVGSGNTLGGSPVTTATDGCVPLD